MATCTNRSLIATLCLGAVCMVGVLPADADSAADAEQWSVDFRCAPPWWQTSICLPDDWQKTLVAKDGGLLYDFRGRHAGFKTKITFMGVGRIEWVDQQVLSPRTPIVRTTKRSGPIELIEETFAVPLPPGAKTRPKGERVHLERVGNKTGLPGWASPATACDQAFRNIAVGWSERVVYGFKADKGRRYSVVFGLCEGYHPAPGRRILDLQIEGKTVKTVDMVAAKGRNVPAVFAFDAEDENGDGWIAVASSAAKGSPDKNTILNVLWVFEQGAVPPPDTLIAGKDVKGALARVDCGGSDEPAGPPRHDVMIVRMVNRQDVEVVAAPSLVIESEYSVSPDAGGRQVRIGTHTTLVSSARIDPVRRPDGVLTLLFGQTAIPPGKERVLALRITRGTTAKAAPITVSEARQLRSRAQRFWQKADLPYDHVCVPDAGIQALVDSSIRNIYQAREIKRGLPAFQVGPTCYRGLWVVDGSFLMEAVTFLGRTTEARNGIMYLLGFQRSDGAMMLIDGHWKETGITLWAVTRHARLTGDKAWLGEVWPKVERGFDYIRTLRKLASAKPDAPNAGLIPDGFSDGGLGGKVPEYTNVYWTMAGMRAAVEAARWLGKTAEADGWEKEYRDFVATFRRAAERDTRRDVYGNSYVPIRMVYDPKIAPQRAQWAFLHAVFPGKVFAADDPLVRGNMAMLEATEREGMVYGTGWLADGIWNYFASFYGHAWLWLGHGQKAAQALYAFANHASPLLVWREEQMTVGQGDRVCGDMPHNWASAEFIRLVRHMLVLERSNELHLLEGIPAKWARPNAVTKLKDIVTEFGPMSLECRVDADRKTIRLKVDPPRRTPPARIIVHLDGWSGKKGTIDLPTAGPSERRIEIRPHDDR